MNLENQKKSSQNSNPSKSLKITLGLELSKANLDLSKVEALHALKIYFEEHTFALYDNLLVITIKSNLTKKEFSNNLLIWLNRLAFTKSAFEILGSAESQSHLLEEVLSGRIHASDSFLWKKGACFRITSKNLIHEKRDLDVKSFAKALSLSNSLGKVDLTQPDLDFTVIKGQRMWLGIKFWENEDSFENRRSHLLKAPHPTGMNPRLARAMINIAKAKHEVLDPFCGAGGILIEGLLLDLHVIGIDISKDMIERAELNTSYFGKAELFERDALTWNKPVECIVTDIPYGKNSKLEGDLKRLTSSFLDKFGALTETIVICCPKSIKLKSLVKASTWKLLFEADLFIHSGLTRNIVLLGKK